LGRAAPDVSQPQQRISGWGGTPDLDRRTTSYRISIGRAGAALADVRRALATDDDELDDENRARSLAELRAEIAADGGFDVWWRS
jgi:hypothetical protein